MPQKYTPTTGGIFMAFVWFALILAWVTYKALRYYSRGW